MKNENKWTFYCHENKINKKKYFGITSMSPSARFKNGAAYSGCTRFFYAIKKYGWDGFAHYILRSGLTKEQAEMFERLYIQLFNTQNPKYGYNVQSGGIGGRGVSEQGRERLREFNSGEKSKCKRAIVAFDLNGNRLKEFPLIKFAAQEYGINPTNISGNLCRGRGTCGGYIFKYAEDVVGKDRLPEEMVYSPNEQRLVRGGNSWHSHPVILYDKKTGFRVKDFDCIKSASEFAGVDVYWSFSGRDQYSGDYICRSYEKYKDVARLPKCELPKKIVNCCKPVSQFDFNGNLLKTYPSARQAERETGVSCKVISMCLKKKCHSAGGFVWRLENDDSPFVRPNTCAETRRERGAYNYIAVDQIDLKTGKVIATYKSLTDAANAVGSYKTSIKNIIDHVGNNRTAKSFGWRRHIE